MGWGALLTLSKPWILPPPSPISPSPSFFWPSFLCAGPPHHTHTLPDGIAPKSAGKDGESESQGRRATNPDFIVREGEKGKTWVGGRGCYIVKQKELMGRGRPVGACPPPGSVLEGLTIRKPQGGEGGHDPARVVQWRCLVGEDSHEV